MKRLLASLLAIVLLPAAAFAHDDPVIVLVEFSTQDKTLPQDWSGKASVENGILEQVIKVAGGADSLVGNDGWDVIFGRQGQPGVRSGKAYMRKGVAVKVACSSDAVLTFETKAGTFSVKYEELQTGDPVTRLDGNVTLQIVAEDQVKLGGTNAARGGQGQPRYPAAPTAGDLPTKRLTDADKMSEFPALAALGDTLVAAWVEWRTDHDVLRLRVKQGDVWGDPTELTARDGTDIYQPQLAVVGQTIWCVWPERVDDNVDLYAVVVYPKVGPVSRVTKDPLPDFAVKLAAQGDRLALCWQSWRGGDANVFYTTLKDGQPDQVERVSPADANDWDPDLTMLPDGSAAVVWDSYVNGNYDVFCRLRRANGWGDPVLITGTPEAEFHACVTSGPDNRVWIGYDIAPRRWGKDYGKSYRNPDPAVARGLHDKRTLGVRVLDGNKILKPADDFSRFGPPLDQFAELPRLAFDGSGTLWLVFRHWTQRKPTEIYEEFASQLEAGGWSLPYRLAGPAGRNTQHPAVCRAADGSLLVAVAGDGRSKGMKLAQGDSPIYGVWLGTLPGGGGGQSELVDAPAAEPQPELETSPRQVTTQVGGQTYTLAYGDCHRHTDIRGHGAVDASVMDTYRYAIDAARLDFVATTDHNDATGGTWLDGLRPYQWWWTEKAAELYHHPPQFVTLFAYEHSMNTPGGHRNVIFPTRHGEEALRRIDRAKPEDNQPQGLWAFLKGVEPAIDVPHTFAEKAQPKGLFDWPNPAVEPLLEIYQGARSSYEAAGLPPGERRGDSQLEQPGNFARDALANGCKYGFVSFSDHGSTHLSYAGVWASSLTRRGIWDGMRQRRTFAASDDLVVEATLAGHALGEEFKLTGQPRLQIKVSGQSRLRQVDVVRNGQVVYSFDPKGRETAFEYEDNDRPPGAAYYYVRVMEIDPDQPDGDPEMAWASPFFVDQG